MKRTILITGGAGFIGSNLCEHFLLNGYKVRCLDSFITGKKSNIEAFLNDVNFELIEGDIRDVEVCLAVTEGVDLVSHQAALGSVPRSIQDPIPTNEINSQGFLNMLYATRVNGVKRFVYASSSSVYGDSVISPKKEDDLGQPLSPYAVSKISNELYGRVFHDLYGIETIGLRYFNVFGPKQDPNGSYAAAIPKFINLLNNGESPEIHGDGLQTRDFTYIKNVIAANEKALTVSNENAYGEAYNVACGESYALIDVVKMIKENLSLRKEEIANIPVKHIGARVGDIRNSLADISKIKKKLGYEIVVGFELGMKEYIATLKL